MRACVDGGIAAVFRELGQVRQGKVDVFESVQQENSSHDRSETCTECKFLRKKITSAHALQSTGKDKWNAKEVVSLLYSIPKSNQNHKSLF